MIIIIGSGLAGYTTAKELRKHDADTPLTIITADDGVNYSKPMLSNALAKSKTPATLAMQDSEKMAATLNATILTHTQVDSINADAKTISTSNGELDYDKLVLALGASAFTPPLEGNGVDEIETVNSLVDYADFYPKLEQAQSIAIIGPGLIGCEFANDIASSDKTINVMGPDPYPLSLLLPEAAGKALQSALEGQGISFHLGVFPKSVNKTDSGYAVALDNGTTINADLVLSATGLRPNISLAQSAGLTTNRGICVDRTLRTSDANIFALGDCVEIEERVMPYIMPIMNAARALGQTLAGNDTPITYPPMPVVIKTPAHPIVVSSPAPNQEGDWEVESDDEGVKALFKQGDDLLGFVLTGTKTTEKQSLAKLLPPVFA